MISAQLTEQQRYVIALRALPAFGLSEGTLTEVQHLVNSSFRVQHMDGDYYLRVYNVARYDRTTIESELIWLHELADRGLAVPHPRRNCAGGYLWQTTSSGDTRHHVAVTAWLDGIILPGDERTVQHYKAVGVLLAQLHRCAANWPPPPEFRRARCDAAGLYGAEGAMGQREAIAWPNLTLSLRSDLERARAALIEHETIIGRSPHHYGLIHGDPSFGNLLFRGTTPALIDFDDCGWGFYSYDLSVVLAGAWGKEHYTENQQALLAGYEMVRSLADSERAAIPAMMAARAASIILWAAAEDPAHPWIAGQHERLLAYLHATPPPPAICSPPAR